MFYNEQAGYGYQQVYPQVPAQRAADPFLNPGTYGTPAQQQQMAQQQQQVVAHPAGSNIFGAHATPAPSYPVPVPAWAVRAAAPGSSAPAASAAPGFAAPFAVPGAPVAPTGAPAYGYPSAYSYAPPSALQPQQLESVSKDEDPVYGPVGRARGKIERALTSDVEISPELAQTLLDATEPYTAPPSATAAFRVARVTKSTPLPDALHRELNFKHLTARMGLFEEIERAWFTVDNKLFLWDYTDGREFSRYDQQADTIQAVGLVRARKDVFVDDITHLLVVCTASRASLLGLCRSEKGELSLYATNLATETATAMIDIKGTDAGRIFLLGANKDLYELEYSTTGGWLSGGSKMWITNRSSSYLSTWVPSILTSGSNEGIESFVVDPKQGRLFVLRSRGEIEYYSITGSNFESRGKYASLHADFQRLRYGGATPAQGSRVVSIAIVGAHESTKAWLVAISASGARIYLGQSLYGGVSLQMVGHRAPLPETTRVAPQSFYSSGTTVAVQVSNDSEPSTRVTITSPWAGRQSAMRENFESYQPPVLQEWSVVETIPSQVWTIAEVHETNPANAPTTLRRSDNIALSALPRQATVGARKLLLLATSGIFWVTLPRPIDMLEADIDLEKEAAVTAARNAFGRVQLASMAVLLGTRAVSGSENKSPDLASAAMSILLAAEAPIIRTSQTGVRTIVYSPRHDGLALILARLLRPVWNAKVAVPAGAKKLGLGVPVKTLQSVQARLAELRRYLDEHPFPRHQAEGDAKTAWDQEELSLHGLQTLLKQAIEAISFVLLLNDYKLADVIAKTDAETQSTLQSLTFQALLTSPNGREVARKLVTALIELQIGADLGIDNLSAILQQRCGSFVQSGDVVLYKAEEGLRRAEGTRDAHERAEQLAESLRLFERAAESAPAAVFPRLHDATRRYRALRDVRATIELPLRVATELDRDDKAGDYVRDGRQPGDPRAAFLEQRQECYQLVVQALGSYDDELNKPGAGVQASRLRDEAYALAIASDDELFHFYLYDWIVALGRSDNLLEFDTPFIETYLQLTASNVPDRRDLLWKYYARREDYLPAAKALADLALREGNISLSERVYYLAQALTNTKSAASVGAEDVEFMTTLQERIDIAQVQLEIVRAVEAHPDMSDADKAEPLQQLEAELLTLDDMYQRFARPLRLFESILLILKTADLRLEDVCTAVWMQLIRTRAAQVPIDASVGELVTDLCRKFYPSEGAPADLILPLVYGEAAPYEESTAPGWATEALHAGGVGLRDLWDAVTMMHDEMAPETREYFAEEAAALLAIWLKHPSLDLPPADVDQFATAYILRTQGATLDARRSETRKMMNAAKAAAAKF